MKSSLRIPFLTLSLALAWPLAAAVVDLTPKNASKPPPSVGTNDALVAMKTARVLETYHYLRHPVDDEISSHFLDRYIDSLDPVRLFFLQSDLAEFEQYRLALDDLILVRGDTTPAYRIFARFLQRLDQQYATATNFLETGKFEFTGNDRFLVNRKNAPRPKSLEEAKQLWTDRLRSEYLQEKLNYDKPKKATATAGKTEFHDKDGKKSEVKEAPVKKQSPAEIHEEILDTLRRRSARILRYWHDMESEDVLQHYLTALAHAYDPHSDYQGKYESENFKISMKLSLAGIGAVLRSEDGYCRVVSLSAGGPADKTGKIRPEDKIIAVAQGTNPPVDVVEMKLNKVVEMIRGEKGTEVRLTVVPADAPDARRVVSILRDVIKLDDQAAKSRIYEVPEAGGKTMRLGVIDLPSFYADFGSDPRKPNPDRKSTTADVEKLVRKLKEEKMDGLILDLRRNGGGSLEEAINLTGLFIKEGPVVQVKDFTGRIESDSDTNPAILYDGPMIVLTSRFSASASEILAGALQDYGRALIVGDSSTHGKGTVQTILELSRMIRGPELAAGAGGGFNPGDVKVTIRKFYRASGASTQLKGVVPDIVLPSVNNHAEVGEDSLDYPLKWDVVEPAKYTKVNRVQPYLTDLKKASSERVAKDPDFNYIREDIARYQQLLSDRTVSLNEAQRKREKQEIEDRVKARRKELAARPEPKQKVYEITLKDVAKPGLPEPLSRTNLPPKAAFSAAAPDEPEAEQLPDLDVPLEEARRILQDYIRLESRGTVARK